MDNRLSQIRHKISENFIDLIKAYHEEKNFDVYMDILTNEIATLNLIAIMSFLMAFPEVEIHKKEIETLILDVYEMSNSRLSCCYDMYGLHNSIQQTKIQHECSNQ